MSKSKTSAPLVIEWGPHYSLSLMKSPRQYVLCDSSTTHTTYNDNALYNEEYSSD